MYDIHTALHPRTLSSAANLLPGMRVADIGCGAHGGLVYHIARMVGPEGRVYAVDVQPHVLKIIEGGDLFDTPRAPLETVWSDIEQFGGTAIPHASLDRMFLVNVVSELRDIPAALRECDRLLGPEGTILIVDWGQDDHPLAPATLVPPEVIAEAASTVGTLMLEDILQFGDSHYGVIIGRK